MHSTLPLGGGWLALLLSLVVASASWAGATDAPSRSPLDPDSAVTSALSLHPDVLAAEARLMVARGQQAQATWLSENPQITGSVSHDGERMGFDLVQPVSLSGEGWHARSGASSRIRSAEAGLERARLVVAADTRQAYVDAVVATGQVEIALGGADLARRLTFTVSRMYEEGEASLLELRLARLAEARAMSTLLESRAGEADALGVLAERTGLIPEELERDPLVAVPASSAPESSDRLDISASRSALLAADADLRRERAAALPRVGLGFFADVEDGLTYAGPSVEVVLPLFNRNQAGRSLARGEVQLAGARVATVTARAETELRTARARATEAEGVADRLQDDSLGEAREVLASIEAGYRAGELDLPTTVLLQGEVLEGEAAVMELLGQVAAARLDLLLATEDSALLGGTP